MTSKMTKQFSVRTVRQRKVQSATHELTRPFTFWIAVLSLFAFVSGNMLGTHGWTVFWSSVLGNANDELIVYDGAVSPIAYVPDPLKWAKYGGDQRMHDFTQAPKDTLIPLPAYKPVDSITDVVTKRFYSVDFGGTYATGGGNGSHAGVDIAAPRLTPVLAMMNGEVTKVINENGGYGNYVILRHPNVPDPTNPTKTVTLYSLYAHMDSTMVTKGMLVKKGSQIGTVGNTGDASGYHLHVSLQRVADAWWPFTYSELRSAGLSFSQGIDTGFNREQLFETMTNPMAYVQARYAPINSAIAQASSSSRAPRLTLADRRAQRLSRAVVLATPRVSQPPVLVATRDDAAPAPMPAAPVAPVVVAASSAASSVSALTAIAGYRIEVPYDFNGRDWTTVRITLEDAEQKNVVNPEWTKDITLRTAYGQAEFKPEVLKKTDFKNGVATVQMLPRGRTTVVVNLMPMNVQSSPIRYSGN